MLIYRFANAGASALSDCRCDVSRRYAVLRPVGIILRTEAGSLGSGFGKGYIIALSLCFQAPAGRNASPPGRSRRRQNPRVGNDLTTSSSSLSWLLSTRHSLSKYIVAPLCGVYASHAGRRDTSKRVRPAVRLSDEPAPRRRDGIRSRCPRDPWAGSRDMPCAAPRETRRCARRISF